MKILTVLILFFTQTVLAFTLNSSSNPNLQGWANTDIKIYLNPINCPAGVDVAGVISEAVEVWNNIPNSSIKVSYGGSTTSTTSSNPPTAYCETNFQGVVGADQDAVPGAASADGSSGRITRAVLYLNASGGLANIGHFDRETLKIILAHEIGHILGLGHSSDTSALMYYDASYKQRLSLAQDDIDGMTYLYPQSDINLNSLVGCGLVKSQLKGPSDGELTLWCFLLILPLLMGLFLRRWPLTEGRRT